MGCTVDITLSSDEREGTQSYVLRWLKAPGETVVIHEPLLEISTDKVTVEVAAPANGVLLAILKGENDQIHAGEILGQIEAALCSEQAGGAASYTQDMVGSAGSQRATNTPPTNELSPAVRKLLAEHNLDPSCIQGTGASGRITHQDILTYLEQQKTTGEGPTLDDSKGSRRIPHSPMRKSIANHMVQSLLHTAPHVTTVFEANLSRVIAHRDNHKEEFARQGARLTLTAYFVHAMVSAIRAVPEVNSRWHDDALEVFDSCHIGVATALPAGGLVVPVIRDTQKLSFPELVQQLHHLTEKARAGSLSPSDVKDGTCTLTNHGVSGSLIATPIINQPQSAIVGVGKLQKRVTVVEEDGQDVARIHPMAFVTLTLDHRALDGFQANTFLSQFVRELEGW